MKSKAGKIPWSSHPAMGVPIGLAFVFAFVTFETRVTPWALTTIGPLWGWLKTLLFFSFLGWFLKFWLWKRLPRRFAVENMTPEEFAGATPAAVQQQKERFSQRAPLPEVRPIEAAKIERPALALNFAELEARSAELNTLGFKLLQEGAVRVDTHATPTFVRFFGHPEGHFAEVFQFFMAGSRHPLTLAFVTRLGDGWLVGDSTQRSNWMLWIVRRNRALGKPHDPQTPTATLWRSHCERCAWVAQCLNRPIALLSFDEYMRIALDDLKEMRALSLKRSLWWNIMHYLLLRPRNGEWWGELKPPSKRNSLVDSA